MNSRVINSHSVPEISSLDLASFEVRMKGHGATVSHPRAT